MVKTIEQFDELFEKSLNSKAEAEKLFNETTKPVLAFFVKQIYGKVTNKMKKAEIVSWLLSELSFEEPEEVEEVMNENYDIINANTWTSEQVNKINDLREEMKVYGTQDDSPSSYMWRKFYSKFDRGEITINELDNELKNFIEFFGLKWCDAFNSGKNSRGDLALILIDNIAYAITYENPTVIKNELTPEQINKGIYVWQMSYGAYHDTAEYLFKRYKVSKLKALAGELRFNLNPKWLKRDIARELGEYIRAIANEHYRIYREPKSESVEAEPTSVKAEKLEDFAGVDRKTDELIIKRNLELVRHCKTRHELTELLNTGNKKMITTIGLYFNLRFNPNALKKSEIVNSLVDEIMKVA